MEPYKFIEIEDKRYPTVIMGEDHFTGWFSKCKNYNSEEERKESYRQTIETAYSFGVRGFSISSQSTLIENLKEFKQKNPDIVCIANHHWHSNYYIGKESLWKPENIGKLGNLVFKKIDRKILEKTNWFKGKISDDVFSKEEIQEFRLDEKEYNDNLDKFSEFCDFCLGGNLGISALVMHGREDIIEKEIKLARKKGFIPLLMAEGGGLALPYAEKLNVGGSWMCINSSLTIPNLETALKTIKKSTKLITGYKILSGGEGFNLKKSVEFIKNTENIKAIVIGVNGVKQAKETFSLLGEYWT
jgi:hypothetical protein